MSRALRQRTLAGQLGITQAIARSALPDGVGIGLRRQAHPWLRFDSNNRITYGSVQHTPPSPQM